MIDKIQFKEWFNHPVTQVVLELIRYRRDNNSKNLFSLSPDQYDDRFVLMSIGEWRAFNDILNLYHQDIDEFEEFILEERKVKQEQHEQIKEEIENE